MSTASRLPELNLAEKIFVNVYGEKIKDLAKYLAISYKTKLTLTEYERAAEIYQNIVFEPLLEESDTFIFLHRLKMEINIYRLGEYLHGTEDTLEDIKSTK